ncbi:uncharacterized protein LOC114353611 [Ostrinia furnacalis]|uniref:uncharacterized protein LOC114353611 n=1 Tax=Ostrinia furnacalis TaxID=93504 RepID=UPI00103FEC0C|nr:uncharacterized protein LOC114353611 [Ostrinia furnacalis]
MVFFALFFIHMLLYGISQAYENKHFEAKKDESSRFAALLQELIKVNEGRIEAMKQLVRLQEYSVAPHHLRMGREDDQDRLVVIIVGDRKTSIETNPNIADPLWNPEPYKGSKDLHKSAESDSTDDVNNDDAGQALRKGWQYTCGKKMKKVCTKACKIAYKNVCMTYDCKKKMKKSLKKECKRMCKSKFDEGKYSGSRSDSDSDSD